MSLTAISITARLRTVFAVMAVACANGISISQAATGLVVDSQPGDFVGGGQSYYFTRADGAFTANKNAGNMAMIHFTGSGTHIWNLTFVAPGNVPLTPGTYEGALEYPSQPTSRPGLSVTGEGRACDSGTGSFTINEIVYRAGASVEVLDATFVQSCDDGPPLRGRVLFNSTAPLPPRNRITSELAVHTRAGQPFNYVIRTSEMNDTFTAKNLPAGVILNASSGTISGTPMAVGTYAVMLRASGENGSATATLNLVVDPPGYSHGRYTALSIVSEKGDWVGQGKTSFFGTEDGAFTAFQEMKQRVSIRFTAPENGEYWTVTCGAPTGEELAVGRYENVSSYRFSTQPHLSVTGNSHDSGEITGSFEVKEISYDERGVLRTFHASFTQLSKGSTGGLTGDVWYRAERAITSNPRAFSAEGRPFSYQIIANNEPTSFNAIGLRAGLAIDPATGMISGTAATSGIFDVRLEVAGLAGAAADELTLTIKAAQSLGNVSTRALTGTGDDVLIGGFIVTGSDPKEIMIRAIGPSMTGAGLEGVLPDPKLELYNSAGVLIAKNDDWRTTLTGGVIPAAQSSAIEASGLAPSSELESAMRVVLAPDAYTAIVRGFGTATGVGLVEVYDLDMGTNSQLRNISTRGFVGTGDDVMIGGFIMAGVPGTGGNVVVRALGPSLAETVSNVLSNPVLGLYDANGLRFAENDDWQDSQAAEIIETGLAPSKPNESAILTTLPLGSFTAIIRDGGGISGNALVEVYNVP